MEQLWLVCDISGSMAEGGRSFVSRGVVRMVEQYFRYGYAEQVGIRLATWSTEIKVCNWHIDDEVPEEFFDCCGSSSSEVLFSFIEHQPESKFLVMTDAGWSSECEQSMRLWLMRNATDNLRFVLIGDGGESCLKRQKVPGVEEVIELLDGWFTK
jgi:hypothetical protein